MAKRLGRRPKWRYGAPWYDDRDHLPGRIASARLMPGRGQLRHVTQLRPPMHDDIGTKICKRRFGSLLGGVPIAPASRTAHPQRIPKKIRSCSTTTEGILIMGMTPALYSINGIACELGRDRRTVARALRDIGPDGEVSGRKAWRLTTALRALDRVERMRSSNGGSAYDDDSDLHALEIAGQRVQQVLDQLAALPDVKARRQLVPLHSDYDFFGLGLAEGSGLWVGAAHFGASFVGCEHPFDASA